MNCFFYGRVTPRKEFAVCVVDEASDAPLDPHYHIRQHSPTGFAWGYNGSGPAQLALAILCYICRTAEEAQERYQRFKAQVICRIPVDMGWVLSGEAVESWLVGDRQGRQVEIWPKLLPMRGHGRYPAQSLN